MRRDLHPNQATHTMQHLGVAGSMSTLSISYHLTACCRWLHLLPWTPQDNCSLRLASQASKAAPWLFKQPYFGCDGLPAKWAAQHFVAAAVTGLMATVKGQAPRSLQADCTPQGVSIGLPLGLCNAALQDNLPDRLGAGLQLACSQSKHSSVNTSTHQRHALATVPTACLDPAGVSAMFWTWTFIHQHTPKQLAAAVAGLDICMQVHQAEKLKPL